MISYGEIRVTKKNRKIGPQLFVLAVVLLDPSSTELFVDTEVRLQPPVTVLLHSTYDPVFQCLVGWPSRQKVGVLGFYVSDSSPAPIVLPYGCLKEQVQPSSEVVGLPFMSVCYTCRFAETSRGPPEEGTEGTRHREKATATEAK